MARRDEITGEDDGVQDARESRHGPANHEDESESSPDVNPEGAHHFSIFYAGANDDAVPRSREEPFQAQQHHGAATDREKVCVGYKDSSDVRGLDEPERHRYL